MPTELERAEQRMREAWHLVWVAECAGDTQQADALYWDYHIAWEQWAKLMGLEVVQAVKAGTR